MNWRFKVNEKEFVSENKFITGLKILESAGFIPVENYDLYKKITGCEYEPIQYDEKVDLEEPGIECFRSCYRKTISFDVDDESYPTKELELSPIQILTIAGCDPSKFYLKQILEHIEITYKEDEHKSIDMLGHLKFITCKKEPTTVS